MNSAKSVSEKVIDDENFPHEILIAEFNYARETAGQAMEDRHKMVNFFLIIVGILASGMGILLQGDSNSELLGAASTQKLAISVLLFFIVIIGVLYVLKLIRLRSAWFESALCMNHIKDYYDEHFAQWQLKAKAFRWTRETLIRQDISKLTTLFGYSAILVILVDSAAFLAFLLVSTNSQNIILIIILSTIVFLTQIAFYKSALSEKRLPK